MKQLISRWAGPVACVALLTGGFTGCRKPFSDRIAQAEQSFNEKNYINTIDTLTTALTDWREGDGAEEKGRAYEMLGKSYVQLRNTDKAAEAFTQAVANSNHTYDSALALGNIYLTKGIADRAQKSFLDALRMKPNDPLALLGLGNSYFSGKDNEKAIATFEKILDVSPGVREAIESLQALKKPAKKVPTVIKRNAKPPQKMIRHKKRS